MRKLFSGNEAIALGAWEAGVRFASAYPGTPSTEILENLLGYAGLKAEWASNEKVALDAAAGAALVGARALAAMKHVGLNVAADTFFSLSYTGVKAGLVIVSADDPGTFSSQNEQDNRQYARFAKVPCLEPSNSQEAKDFVAIALHLSEQFDTPVLLRSTTRLSHSKSAVEVGLPQRRPDPDGPLTFPDDPTKYVIIPAHARQRHPVVEERLQRLAEWAETTAINRLEWGERRLGIVTTGMAYQYAREVLGEVSYLKLGLSYPLPLGLIRQLRQGVDRLIVVEELDPFFEEQIRAAGIQVDGGKDLLGLTGELTVPIVRRAAIQAGLIQAPAATQADAPLPITLNLPRRQPALCPGCPHRSVFYALNKQKVRVSGDIGCYSIGVLPPFNAMDTILSMGAGLGMAHGMGQAGVQDKFVAVIGDSTFFHSGLAPLASTVYNQGVVTTIVLDNFTTGMTGGQENPGQKIEIEPVVRALGVRHVWTVDAFDQKGVEKAIKEALAIRNEPTVVVVHGSCVLIKGYKPKPVVTVDAGACTACGVCFRVGCPAILKSEEIYPKNKKPKAVIDPLMCVGCDICLQVCPFHAIYKTRVAGVEQTNP
ncbi:MAG: thiamine pyrophosphate-dependent enzyme [Chloroflexota bacterium]